MIVHDVQPHWLVARVFDDVIVGQSVARCQNDELRAVNVVTPVGHYRDSPHDIPTSHVVRNVAARAE